jgi:ATP-dependent protease Clp ATPase subunit
MQAACSFCDDEKGPLIVSKNGAYICEHCALECSDIFEENREKQRKKDNIPWGN